MEDYLAHYGILGMKWGVRRFQNKDGSLTKLGKKRYESRLKPPTEEKPKYPNPKNLSDKELKDMIDRLRNEKTYLELTSPVKKEDKKYFVKCLEKFGDTALNTLIDNSAKSLANQIAKAAFGENAVTTKDKKK